MSTKKTVVLISGANSGIGLAAATQLARDHQYHVIIGSRNAAAGEKVATDLVAAGLSASSVQLEVTSDESIAAAIGSIEREYGILDVLVNNAGTLLDQGYRSIEEYKAPATRELFTQTLSINVTGAACLTEACLPLLRKSEFPRVVFVSSRMGSIAVSTDKSTPFYSADYKAYDASKAALNMLAVNYARILEDAGGVSNAVCPGLVQTKLTGFTEYGSSTALGAKQIVALATAAKGSSTATYSDRDGSIPW